MPRRIVEYTKKQPARAMILIVAVLTMLAGFFMFTPFYGPLESAPLFSGPIAAVGIWITAIINIVIGIPALYGVYKAKTKWTSNGAGLMFAWYLFIALSRAFAFPYPGRLLWLPPLMVSLLMGVIYLEQKDLLHKEYIIHTDELRDGDVG